MLLAGKRRPGCRIEVAVWATHIYRGAVTTAAEHAGEQLAGGTIWMELLWENTTIGDWKVGAAADDATCKTARGCQHRSGGRGMIQRERPAAG